MIKHIASASPQVNRDFRSLGESAIFYNLKVVASLLSPVIEADQELNVAGQTTQNIVRSQLVQEQVEVEEGANHREDPGTVRTSFRAD